MSKDRTKEKDSPEIRFEIAKDYVLELLEHPLLPELVTIIKNPIRSAGLLSDSKFVEIMPSHLQEPVAHMIDQIHGIALPKSPWNETDKILVRTSALKKEGLKYKSPIYPEEIIIEEAMHLLCVERSTNTDKGKLIWRGFNPAYYAENLIPVYSDTVKSAQEEARVGIAKTILILLSYGQSEELFRNKITSEESFRRGCRLFYSSLTEEQIGILYSDKYPAFYFVPEFLSATSNLKEKINILFNELYSDSYEQFVDFLKNFDKKYVNRKTKMIFQALVHWCYYNNEGKSQRKNESNPLSNMFELRKGLIAARKIFGKESYWIDTIK